MFDSLPKKTHKPSSSKICWSKQLDDYLEPPSEFYSSFAKYTIKFLPAIWYQE